MNTLNFLNQTYTLLRRHGLATTKADFSERMLGRTKSYLTSMSARNRCPPLLVISHLKLALQKRLDAFRSNPHFGQPYTPALNLAYERLREISGTVAAYEGAVDHKETAEPDEIHSQPVCNNDPAEVSVFAWLKSAVSKQRSRGQP